MEEPREIAERIALGRPRFRVRRPVRSTDFLATNREHSAIGALARFRSLARAIAVRRGVLVAKRLGDLVMIVSLEVGLTLATVPSPSRRQIEEWQRREVRRPRTAEILHGLAGRGDPRGVRHPDVNANEGLTMDALPVELSSMTDAGLRRIVG